MEETDELLDAWKEDAQNRMNNMLKAMEVFALSATEVVDLLNSSIENLSAAFSMSGEKFEETLITAIEEMDIEEMANGYLGTAQPLDKVLASMKDVVVPANGYEVTLLNKVVTPLETVLPPGNHHAVRNPPGEVYRAGVGEWFVESGSNKKFRDGYLVARKYVAYPMTDNASGQYIWICSCPAFQRAKHSDTPYCKHIYTVSNQLPMWEHFMRAFRTYDMSDMLEQDIDFIKSVLSSDDAPFTLDDIHEWRDRIFDEGVALVQ